MDSEKKHDKFSQKNMIFQKISSRKEKEKCSLSFGMFFRSFYQCTFLLLLIFCIMSFIFCFFIAPSTGKLAGNATGSFHGISTGLTEGAEAGKVAGLSAEDTVAHISNKMKNSGKLQILLVDLYLTDFYQQGDDYAALLGSKGEGVYSIDLAHSHTSYNVTTNQITIEIPEPVFEVYLDQSTVEILAEYEPKIFNGSTENGYQGYLNSDEQKAEKAREEFCSTDMIKQVESLAQSQVESLAKSVCGNNIPINICFLKTEE